MAAGTNPCSVWRQQPLGSCAISQGSAEPQLWAGTSCPHLGQDRAPAFPACSSEYPNCKCSGMGRDILEGSTSQTAILCLLCSWAVGNALGESPVGKTRAGAALARLAGQGQHKGGHSPGAVGAAGQAQAPLPARGHPRRVLGAAEPLHGQHPLCPCETSPGLRGLWPRLPRGALG